MLGLRGGNGKEKSLQCKFQLYSVIYGTTLL